MCSRTTRFRSYASIGCALAFLLALPWQGHSGQAEEAAHHIVRLPLDCTPEPQDALMSASCSGTFECAPDRFGREQSALGLSENLGLGCLGFPSLEGDFTMDLWFLPGSDRHEVSSSLLVVGDSAEGVSPLRLLWEGASRSLIVDRDEWEEEVRIPRLASAWQHVALTRTAETLSVLANGVLAHQVPDGLPLGRVYSLGDVQGQGQPFHGFVDALVIEAIGRSVEEIVDLTLEGGPSAYLGVREAGPERLASPGSRFEALRFELRTGTTEDGGGFLLWRLRLQAMQGGPEDPLGIKEDLLSYFTKGRLLLSAGCGSEDTAVRAMSTGVDAEGFLECLLPEPAVLPEASRLCLALELELPAGAPEGGTLQFSVRSPDDLDITRSDGARAFVVGQRVVQGAATSGDPLLVDLPRVRLLPVRADRIKIFFDAEEDTQHAQLHRFTVQPRVPGRLRIVEIIYRAFPGTRLRGVRRTNLFMDANHDGEASAEEFAAAGSVERGLIRFSEMDVTIDADATLILHARFTDSVLRGSVLLPPILLVAAAALFFRNRRRRSSGALCALALAFCCSAICSPMFLQGGCRKDRPSNVRVGLMNAEDFKAVHVETGLPAIVEDFPPEGIKGNTIRARSRQEDF